MSFPEEPLDLPPTEGGGYYPATISEQLNKRKYHIVRKLGYGPQSSTWLAFEKLWRGRKYFAIKIFTIAASKRVQIPILNNITDLDPTLRLPYFHESFWERSDDGWYLCVVMKPMSTSVRVLQLDAENQRLPVHAVRRIVSIVSDALEGLHDAGIMHGGNYLSFSVDVAIQPLRTSGQSRKHAFLNTNQNRWSSTYPWLRTFTSRDKDTTILHCTITAAHPQFQMERQVEASCWLANLSWQLRTWWESFFLFVVPTHYHQPNSWITCRRWTTTIAVHLRLS